MVFEADVDAAAAEVAEGPLRQLGPDLGRDAVEGLDEHEPELVAGQGRVLVDRGLGGVVQLGHRLDARVAAADEDDGQEA